MVLIVYKTNVYKEFYLPGTDNSDYSVVIERGEFELQSDVELKFEIRDNAHYLLATGEYTLKLKGKDTNAGKLQNENIFTVKTTAGQHLYAIAVESSRSFSVFEKFSLSNLDYISIGAADDNLIRYNFNDLVSKYHCEIRRDKGGYYISDTSANGIFVGHKRLPKRTTLNFGDDINIFGLHLVFLDNLLCVGTGYGDLSVNYKYLKKNEFVPPKNTGTVQYKEKQERYFNRAPRVVKQINSDTVEIEPPPPPKFSPKKPILYTIGPAFTMAIPMMLGSCMAIISAATGGRSSGAFMYTGIITAIASATVGVIWALLNLRYAKVSEAEAEQERFNAYGNYLVEIAENLKNKYEYNARAMYQMYPSASDCCNYSENTPELWNRNRSHADFLFHRLGVGDVDFQVKIQIPKEKFSITYDALSKKPASIKQDYSVLRNVPIGVDLLQNRLVGIIGGKNRAGAIPIMNTLIAQLAANNCYTDVKLVFILKEHNPNEKQTAEFVRWLPHVWSEDRKTRYYAVGKAEASDVFYELVNIFRARKEKDGGRTVGGSEPKKPYYVIFVEDAMLLEGELISKYIYHPEDAYGVSTVILSEYYTELPNECEYLIQNDGKYAGMYNIRRISEEKTAVRFDKVSTDTLRQFSRRLGSIQVREVENSTDVPAALDFLEMYGVHNVEELNIAERWRIHRTFSNVSALIGKKSGGKDCYLDVHEKFHGPHGLVAGTTGSGKSELLQTYILSLAVNYSPEDVSFFLIDYKGGGMANLFKALPHMVGQISNLSGNQVRRAMISIKSENLRRQRLFNECGVNNISNYTRLYKKGEIKEPIPHLFIIIDEFAELKKEEPDFMRELISVAQVGRSLGVHLILATQKPSGTVDENIWSNSKFRLCLRVQDKQDSNDMLHKPDAAFLTGAGRAYLQVGNDEIYELFQSGWSGAPYAENAGGLEKTTSLMIVNTGKTALVGNRARIKKKEKEKYDWLCEIAEILSAVVKENGMPSVSALKQAGRLEKNAVIQKTVDIIRERYDNFEDNTKNRNAVEHIANLWQEANQISEIVNNIILQAKALKLTLPEKKEKTQLEVIVRELNRLAVSENVSANMLLWLPVLETMIPLEKVTNRPLLHSLKEYVKPEKDNWSLDCEIGLYDDPANRSQLPMTVDLAQNGHVAVCGMVSSGKSTFLQTLIFSLSQKYAPEVLNFYLLDFSNGSLSAFADLPHVGGIIDDSSQDRMDKFFHMLNEEMEKRKHLFGGGNYAQYVSMNGLVMPAWCIVFDNYGSFREKTDNRYDDFMLRLVKEGIGYGMRVIFTAGGFGLSEIPGKIADNIRTVIALELGDKFKYMDVFHTTRVQTLPEAGVRGRGLAFVDSNLLEFQTCLPLEDTNDFTRGQKIAALCEEIKNSGICKAARRIPEIPENPTWENMVSNVQFAEEIQTFEKLPFAYNVQDASVYSVQLSSSYCYSISGKARTGKTNTMQCLIRSAADKGGRIVIFEKATCEFRHLAEETSGEYLNDDSALFKFFAEFKGEFVRRNKIKRGLLEKGATENELYEQMKKEKPVFFFIADINEFVNTVYQPKEGVGEMKGFVENITERGSLHNIFFFACINTEKAAAVSAYQAYRNFISYKTGIHLGGNISNQRIFTFQNISFAEQNKPMKPGTGLVPSENDDTIALKVIVPFYR